MSRQTVEIDEGSKDLDRIKTVNRAFKEESNRQANEFIAEQNEIETRLSDNIGIYHSNLSNFVRINAEANMLMYFVKRKEYTQKLDELTAKFAYWKRTKA